MRGRGTLRGQALVRLLLLGLLAGIAIALVATNNFRSQREREIAQKRTVTQAFYERELARLEERWRDDAEQMKTRIEFTRILEEQDAGRWAKLNATLNAQFEFTYFSNLLVARETGQVLYRYGPESQRMGDTALLFSSSWHYSLETRELYRVYRLPVWLGSEGQGLLILLKSVNNAALKSIAAPETHLHLYYHDDVQATSNGLNPAQILPGMKQPRAPNGLLLIQSDLPWPGDGAQPTLIVQRELHVAYPLHEFLLRPLAAVLIIIVSIWLGLGRWLTRTVQRVENLESITNNFRQSGEAAPARARLQAAIDQPDEISDLTRAMDTLIQEVEIRHLEQKAYLDTLALLEEAVLEITCDNTITRASPGWLRLSHSDSAIGKPLYSFIHNEDREALQLQCLALSSGEKNYAVLRLRLHVENSTHQSWLECRLVPFHNEDGTVAGIRGVLRDITQTYLHEKQITHMALHDALTGLPNRLLLEDRLKISLRLASRTTSKVGVFFIDLDHFKNINDSLGHKAGDRLLVAFSEALCKQLRTGDTLARWGGDEFVLLLPDIETEVDIREVARKVTSIMQTPLHVDDVELSVTFSMGAAIYPDDGEDMETLFSQADRAMFYAKSQGRNQGCFFRDMTTKGIGKKELYIQNRLVSAITGQHIQAWFQPIVAASNGACTGAEVLARWNDDEQGWISPATFIPMAENSGMIRELGHQIWMSSVEALTTLHQKGHLLKMAINISKRQLFAPYFTEQLLETLVNRPVRPADIILEITESVALIDVEHAAERLRELKQAGFRIAIDDFGTGYSSLSQLHEMHVDELKIDISFVRRLNDPRGLSMTQAIINLARALNLETVAEGVENEATATKLRQLGVDCLQGYHYAKPMPYHEFEHWLGDHAS